MFKYFSSVSSLKMFGKKPKKPVLQINPDHKLPTPFPVKMNHPSPAILNYRIKNRPLKPLYQVPIQARVSLFPYFESPQNSKLINIAVLGPPNAGKSSFINSIIGKQILAVSPKNNTTQQTMMGIRTDNQTQLIFNDTPGFLSTHGSRTNSLSMKGWELVKQTDYSLFLFDPARPLLDDIRVACSRLQKLLQKQDMTVQASIVGESKQDLQYRKKTVKLPIPAALVVTKVDLVTDRRKLRYIVNQLQEYAYFQKVFYVSTEKEYNVEAVVEYLKGLASEGEWGYHPAQATDLSDVDQVREVFKKYFFQYFNQELPYQWIVRVFGWTPYLDGSLRIDVEILVKTEVQKGIFIGKDARNIKKIANGVQSDLVKLYRRPITLKLYVSEMKKQVKQSLKYVDKPDSVHPRLMTTQYLPERTTKMISYPEEELKKK